MVVAAVCNIKSSLADNGRLYSIDSPTYYLLIIHYLLSPVRFAACGFSLNSVKIIDVHTSIETRTSVLIVFPADP